MSSTDSAHSPNRKLVRLLSVLVAVLSVAAVFVGANLLKSKEFPLGDLSAFSPDETRAAYAESGDARDLITHLKVLCYRSYLHEDKALTDEIARCGTELLDMAREETIDLEMLGRTDDTLLDLLRLIRSHGAK